MADESPNSKTLNRRGTLAYGQLGQEARLQESYGSVEEGGDSHTTPKAAGARMLARRQTFTEGEQQFPSKFTTWTIETAEDTMTGTSLIINLLADVSPAGVLPLAYGMTGTGYIPAVLMLLLFACGACYSMYLISRTIEISGVKSWDRMWERCIGEQSKWVPSLVLFVVCFGNSLAYICMVGDLISMCLPGFGINFLNRTACIALLAVFPLLPLCMLKDLSALAPTSFLALIAVFWMIIMMVIRFADGSYLPGGQYHGYPAPRGHVTNIGFSTLILVDNLAVAFLCHYNGPKYYREYKDHRPVRFGSRVLTGFTLVSTLFATSMLLGFATFGHHAEGVILNNYDNADMLANIARFGMGFANVFSLPLMFSGLREAALALLGMWAPANAELYDQVWFQNVLSSGLLAVVAALGIIITDAGVVIGLVGAICGSAIIYVIPCFLFDAATSKFLSQGDDLSHPYEIYLVRAIGCIGVFIMFAGSVATLCL
mmetsp:Transcript_46413/g.86734  ORF Transcript_46413/g.86734 Transcript_46413/m.86734 type:complete len:486 (+) Transcript_46413:92-1549(+)